jgi:transcriptional regulator with XRE-family HTH domain
MIREVREKELNKDLNDVLTRLGQRLRQSRKSRNLFTTRLSLLSGVSRPTLYRLERAPGSVRIESLLRVMHVMRLSDDFEELIGEDEFARLLDVKNDSLKRLGATPVTCQGVILTRPLKMDGGASGRNAH